MVNTAQKTISELINPVIITAHCYICGAPFPHQSLKSTLFNFAKLTPKTLTPTDFCDTI